MYSNKKKKRDWNSLFNIYSCYTQTNKQRKEKWSSPRPAQEKRQEGVYQIGNLSGKSVFTIITTHHDTAEKPILNQLKQRHTSYTKTQKWTNGSYHDLYDFQYGE